jgi:nucleotidyltransferase substrate binding protein (TIGR01987 family)
MESTEKYNIRYEQLVQAVATFEDSLSLNLEILENPILIDSVKAGQIQKFECCVELAWKTARLFLYEFHGVDVSTPKPTSKELFLAGIVSESVYESLYQMIEDRNLLSHIYAESTFQTIHGKLKDYLKVFKILLEKLKSIT